MTRRRKTILVALLCLSPAIYWLGREAYKTYLIYQLFTMIEEEGLDFTSYRELTLGPDNEGAEFDLVTPALGFTFPVGTRCEQWDDAWGHLHTCYTLPDGLNKFLEYSGLQLSSLKLGTDQEIEGLQANPVIPGDSTVYALSDPPDSLYPTLTIYAHEPSSRVWVRCWYRPPYE